MSGCIFQAADITDGSLSKKLLWKGLTVSASPKAILLSKEDLVEQ